MIRVRFERLAAAGHLRRSVFLAEGTQPVTEEIGIDPRLYPGTTTAFDSDLHEHPPEELRRIGQTIALLALGAAGLATLRERRRETRAPIRIAFEESAECPEAAALPWELMHDGEEYLALNPRTPIVRGSTEAAAIERIESGRPQIKGGAKRASFGVTSRGRRAHAGSLDDPSTWATLAILSTPVKCVRRPFLPKTTVFSGQARPRGAGAGREVPLSGPARDR